MPNDYPYKRRQNIINTFRELWEQHIMWTRSFINARINNLGELPHVAERLFHNPVDFANVLKMYYGKEASTKFKDLLSDHLSIAAIIVEKLIDEDSEAVEEYEKKWYENADEIAEFMSSINPYWKKQDIKDAFYKHLKMTLQEAMDIYLKLYKPSIEVYDDIESEALILADVMANGIMRQFGT